MVNIYDADEYPLLRRMDCERVFSIERNQRGEIAVFEGCDEHFNCVVSIDELRALGRELVALADAGGPDQDV